MDSQAVGRVVLMSIHPCFADAILRGEKRVEFRKRPVAEDTTHVIVYATKPISAVVGAFTIRGQETTAPAHLWELYRDVSGISLDDFWTYLGQEHMATGIEIGSIYQAPHNLELYMNLGIRRPPQSYQYIDSNLAWTILSEMRQIDLKTHLG